jgi:hypothetical protein
VIEHGRQDDHPAPIRISLAKATPVAGETAMKKTIGIVLLVAGLAGIGLGFGYTASSDAQANCERLRSEAVTLLEQATQAGEGTPQAQELVAQAQEKSDWADGDCANAESMRTQGLMISGAGLLVFLVGLVLFLKGRKAPPAA